MPWTKPYNPPKNQRLATELYTCSDRVYFITVCAHDRQSAFTQPSLARLVLDVLYAEQERQRCSVFSYCLMPDHFHYLVQPREDGKSVLTFTDQFKGKSTNLSWTVGWRGKLWQRGYWDHIVRNEESLVAISQYILDNPVRKGLVAKAEDWPWSGHMNPLPW